MAVEFAQRYGWVAAVPREIDTVTNDVRLTRVGERTSHDDFGDRDRLQATSVGAAYAGVEPPLTRSAT